MLILQNCYYNNVCVPILFVIIVSSAADNVLAILGATSKKSIVESRLQLVTDYCTVCE